MTGYAYYSQKHADIGGGVYRYRMANGETVDCTAYSDGRPWHPDSYFSDARLLGEVVEFVEVVEKPNQARLHYERQKRRPAP